MRRHIFLAATLLFCVGLGAPADVLYNVTVDTSSISGTAGSLDFQFNPGPLVSQAASLEVLNFSSNGALTGPPFAIGNVSGGPLPSPVSFGNGTQYNDYFEAFTFGTTLSFNLLLGGPAVEFPDGVSTSGSIFAFSMFSDTAGTVPTLTADPNGFAATVAINLNGTTTATSLSSQTSIGAPIFVPEPGSFGLAVSTLFLVGAFLRRRRQA